MVTPPQDRKWEMGRDIAIALAYIALLQQDRVCVSVPGALHTPFYFGPAAIHHIGSRLQGLRAGEAADFYGGVRQAVGRIRFPGVAVIISDFLMPFGELELIFNALRAKNLDITAIQVMGPHDLNPLTEIDQVVAIDSESGREVQLDFGVEARLEYQMLLEEHNTLLRGFLHDSRIAYLQARADEDLSGFVVNRLSGVALLQ